MPSRPQVITIGKNRSELAAKGETGHFGDKIQIFVSREPDTSASTGIAGKLRRAPPAKDDATALTSGHHPLEESKLKTDRRALAVALCNAPPPSPPPPTGVPTHIASVGLVIVRA